MFRDSVQAEPFLSPRSPRSRHWFHDTSRRIEYYLPGTDVSVFSAHNGVVVGHAAFIVNHRGFGTRHPDHPARRSLTAEPLLGMRDLPD
jgi:hypothetical protein